MDNHRFKSVVWNEVDGVEWCGRGGMGWTVWTGVDWGTGVDEVDGVDCVVDGGDWGGRGGRGGPGWMGWMGWTGGASCNWYLFISCLAATVVEAFCKAAIFFESGCLGG
jgi:hypothetical protein